ncbi:MAG: FAA hydrolase family protein [Alphaproteobacteria bacterium]|nr:MAG: FAA hydrolase family protein [Alphaproteobacteria bacterium]
MKLASLKEGRDGRLVVVSRRLDRMAAAEDIAPTLQAALDDWERSAPLLAELSDALNAGEIEGEIFDEAACASPLPRAFQWVDGAAYGHHVELLRRFRGDETIRPHSQDNPLIYQGGSDSFLGPREDIPVADIDWGVDFEAEIAVVTDDVPMGVLVEEAGRHIRLLMLVNDVSLRNLIPAELAKGFGFFQSKPSSAFSPIALTPDELGEAWDGGKVHLPLRSWLNGKLFGCPDAGGGADFGFPELIAFAAKTRPLSAGSIFGLGTVSNASAGGRLGRPIAEGGVGFSCIAEQRMAEKILTGDMHTPFLRHGDAIRIEMCDETGESLFGTIEQQVVPA